MFRIVLNTFPSRGRMCSNFIFESLSQVLKADVLLKLRSLKPNSHAKLKKKTKKKKSVCPRVTNTTNSQNRLQLLVSVSVTCETFSGFLLNLFRPCFIHGPPNAPSQDVPALIGPAGGPHVCQGPDLLSALPSFFLYDRQHFFFFYLLSLLAGCTASWEVACSAPESGTFSSSSPRQPTTGCSIATPAITCTRACGGTAFLGSAWHTQTVLVRIAVCLPREDPHLYLLACWQPVHDLGTHPDTL